VAGKKVLILWRLHNKCLAAVPLSRTPLTRCTTSTPRSFLTAGTFTPCVAFLSGSAAFGGASNFALGGL